MTYRRRSARWLVVLIAAVTGTLMLGVDAQVASQSVAQQTRQEQLGDVPRPFNTTPGPLRFSSERFQRFAEAAADGLDYVPGEVLVKFRDGVDTGTQMTTLASAGAGSARDGVRWVGDVAVVTNPDVPDARALAAELQADPDVLWAEPNYLARAAPRDTSR